MIQYLQKLQRRRGFTLIELIVVIAIIAVLAAIIAPGLSGRNEKIRAANMHARDFYSGIQYVITHFQMTESYITPEIGMKDTTDPQAFITYAREYGQNVLVFPYTYIYVGVDNNTNLTVNVGRTYKEMIDKSAIADETLFEKAIREQLGKVLKADYVGYCYALVYNGGSEVDIGTRAVSASPKNMRVLTTHFMTDELPAVTGTNDEYIANNLMFSSSGELINNSICGTCTSDKYPARDNFVGDAGTYFFNIKNVMPDASDKNELVNAIY
ncbi:MAG: prepilin-type N-terminal cleavage/methylation domain-containing protein [Oscillospiraceae bacterium]